MGKPDIFRNGKSTETETSYALKIKQLATDFLGNEKSVYREDPEDADTNFIIKRQPRIKTRDIRINVSRVVDGITVNEEIAFKVNVIIISPIPQRLGSEELGSAPIAPTEWRELQAEEGEILLKALQRSISHR